MRYNSIDSLKAICAFLIVCIHIPLSSQEVSGYLMILTRVAVPIFFMISGYFHKNIHDRGGEGKEILKLFRIFLYANLVYLIWHILFAIMKQQEVFTIFSEVFTEKHLIEFLLLNESPLASHLWYLGAILYVKVIVFICDRLHCRRMLYWITPFLLMGDLMLGKYSLVLFHKEFPYLFVRNYIFVGIPNFCIGCILRSHSIQLKRYSGMMPFCIVLFSITSFIERFILENAGLNATRDNYISTTFLAIAIFEFFLTRKDKKTSRLEGVLAPIGWKYSTWIYILHPIFIMVIQAVMKKIGVYSIYGFLGPIIVYTGTLIFLVCLSRVKQWLCCK